MYAVVRRYEGVTDPAEAGRQVDEGFLPLLRPLLDERRMPRAGGNRNRPERTARARGHRRG